MRNKNPKWIAVSLIGSNEGLKEKFFCSTCGDICERIEKLNAQPKDCINQSRLENFRQILTTLEPA